MAGYTPWPHFTGSKNGDALGVFVAEVADAPRAPSYVPAARELFVDQLYTDLLWRAPTASERAARVAAIDDGSVPRPRLVAELIDSTESKETIAPLVRYYLGILGRQPSRAEFGVWAEYLTSGTCSSSCRQARRQAIVDAMATTAEYQARFGGASPTLEVLVTKLFQGILGRDPSAGEQSAWVSLIQNGLVTRTQAARNLAESAEYVALSGADTTVILTYLGTLARKPTSAELAAWRARVAAGLSRARPRADVPDLARLPRSLRGVVRRLISPRSPRGARGCAAPRGSRSSCRRTSAAARRPRRAASSRCSKTCRSRNGEMVGVRIGPREALVVGAAGVACGHECRGCASR